MADTPLAGVGVLVTRPAGQAEELGGGVVRQAGDELCDQATLAQARVANERHAVVSDPRPRTTNGDGPRAPKDRLSNPAFFSVYKVFEDAGARWMSQGWHASGEDVDVIFMARDAEN